MNKEEILINTVVEGICGDIRRARKADVLRGSFILIYCGIDAMAFLAMPDNQAEVTKRDFTNWVDEYLRVNGDNSTKYPAEDLYGGRCAFVHVYGSESKLSKAGKVRVVGYKVGDYSHVLHDKKMILLDLDLFIDDFTRGVIKFLENAKKDKKLLGRIDKRIDKLICVISHKDN